MEKSVLGVTGISLGLTLKESASEHVHPKCARKFKQMLGAIDVQNAILARKRKLDDEWHR
jgi:hypothetical protein